MKLPVRLPFATTPAEDGAARTHRLFINAEGEPTKLAKGVAAVTLTANALGLQTGGSLAEPAAKAVEKSVTSQVAQHLEPLPGFKVGTTRVVPAEDEALDGFTSAQRNTHDLVESLASTSQMIHREDLNPNRVAPLLPAYKDALEVVELARPPMPSASMPRQLPEYRELVSAHRSNVLELDAATVNRLGETFAARGLDLSDDGLSRFADVRELPAPKGVNRATAQQLMTALEGNQQLTHVPAKLSAEDALFLSALQQLPNDELYHFRQELGVAGPAGALGVQEKTLGNLVLEKPFVDAFRHKLASFAKQNVSPDSLPAFKAAHGLPADSNVDAATARALIQASRTPPPPPQRVVAGYVNGAGRSITVSQLTPEDWLRVDAADAFRGMKAKAAKAGIDLHLNSAFRSHDEQKELYAMYLNGTGNLAARPGHSNHQGGIAVDIRVGPTSSPTYRWLADNARDFGFKRTVPSEPWHWEFHP